MSENASGAFFSAFYITMESWKTFKSRAGLTGHARHCKVAESSES